MSDYETRMTAKCGNMQGSTGSPFTSVLRGVICGDLAEHNPMVENRNADFWRSALSLTAYKH
jgi:hypothetical protein